MFFWVWAMHEGKIVVFPPPYSTEAEASEYGFRHLGSNFEVANLTTRDVAKATRTIKRTVFDRTDNLDLAYSVRNTRLTLIKEGKKNRNDNV